MRILDAEISILDGIESIERACFTQPWSRDSIAFEMTCEDSVFLAAEEDGRIVGFIIARRSFEEAEILNVATAPDMRRRGIGDSLLSTAIQRLEGSGTEKMFLEVRAGNVPAISLYEKYGFVPFGRRRAYYDHPTEDAILMHREKGLEDS